MFRSLLILMCLTPAVGAAERMPNVVFILADDLGAYELGCYGQQKIRTPAIDRLASEGIRFDRFYAGNNVCAPSRCSLLTGKHPGHATIRDNREVTPEGQHPIGAKETTLAELFKKQKYATAAYGKWGLGMFGSDGDPLRHGFDTFFGYNCQRHAHYFYPEYLYRDAKRFDIPTNKIKTGDVHSHDLVEKEALAFIQKHRREPFFLFLPVTLPHVSLQIPESSLKDYVGKLGPDPAYDGKKGYVPHPTPHAAYAAMVTRLDQTVGRIRQLLKEEGLENDTLVIFTSDNGPTHNVGGADSTFFESAGKLRGLKGSMYEGGLRVPFIAAWPGKIQAGGSNSSRFAFWDLFPTFTQLLGDKETYDTDGTSLLPTLIGKGEQKQHEYLYWESPGYGGQQAIIVGDWKAVRMQLGKGVIKTELYDLKSDPNETANVAERHVEVLQKLEALMMKAHTPSKIFPLPSIDFKPAPKKESPKKS